MFTIMILSLEGWRRLQPFTNESWEQKRDFVTEKKDLETLVSAFFSSLIFQFPSTLALYSLCRCRQLMPIKKSTKMKTQRKRMLSRGKEVESLKILNYTRRVKYVRKFPIFLHLFLIKIERRNSQHNFRLFEFDRWKKILRFFSSVFVYLYNLWDSMKLMVPKSVEDSFTYINCDRRVQFH